MDDIKYGELSQNVPKVMGSEDKTLYQRLKEFASKNKCSFTVVLCLAAITLVYTMTNPHLSSQNAYIFNIETLCSFKNCTPGKFACLNNYSSGNNEITQLFKFWRKIYHVQSNDTNPIDILRSVHLQETYSIASYDQLNVIVDMISHARAVAPLGVYQHIINGPYYNATHLCFNIYEHLKNISTKGGSSFHLTVRGEKTVHGARSTDFFNGTYSICGEYFEYIHIVILTMYYYNYRAYVYRTYDFPKHLYFKKVHVLNGKIEHVTVIKHHKYISVPQLHTYEWNEDAQKKNPGWSNNEESDMGKTIPEYDLVATASFIKSIKNIGDSDIGRNQSLSTTEISGKISKESKTNRTDQAHHQVASLKSKSIKKTFSSPIDNMQEKHIMSSAVCEVVNKGKWVLYKDHWRIRYRNYIVGRPDTQKIRHCFQQYENIILGFDSHMREMFFYFIKKTGDPFPPWDDKAHLSLDHKNIHYRWLPRLSEMTPYLDKVRDVHVNLFQNFLQSNNFQTTWMKKKLFVINAGHHDLDLGMGGFFAGLPKTLQVLSELVSIFDKTNTTLIWVSHPPFPYRFTIKGYGRNNFVLAAINAMMRRELTKLGIIYFDYFELLYPLNDFNKCSAHYLCLIPKEQKLFEAPGQVIADLLLYNICY